MHTDQVDSPGERDVTTWLGGSSMFETASRASLGVSRRAEVAPHLSVAPAFAKTEEERVKRKGETHHLIKEDVADWRIERGASAPPPTGP